MWSKRVVVCSGSEQGLRNVLTNKYSNLVVIKPIFLQLNKSSLDCYLKYCHLCIKPLNLDKEIYMYKGDLGFCSLECRERQIYMDDTREMEANSKRILRGGRCETTNLLEEFRHRRHPAFSSSSSSSTTRERVVFSYS